jgi:putative N6-adenine-specific DNA methylase
MSEFFIVVPIGFEDLALKELQYKFSKHFVDESFKANITKGGIELTCELIYGLKLNEILKIPTRILLRIKSQKCRDLPKLFNILKKINWKEFLLQHNVSFSISCHKSRIIHTGRIEKTATDALSAYFTANKIAQKSLKSQAEDQAIFIRFENDDLTISLDTTGEPLYKRSEHVYRGKAGLRENYASAFLLYLLGIADYSDNTLIDPMCGSGTFLKEARDFFNLSKRNYSYQNWTIQIDISLVNLDDIWNFKQVIGYDRDDTVLDKRDSELRISKQDFFKLKEIPPDTIYIMNPPYGKRIKLNSPKLYFKKLIDHINALSPHLTGIIIPKEYSSKIPYKKHINFNQNGIKVDFLTF